MTTIEITPAAPITVEALGTDSAALAALSLHESKANPHPQYATDAEIALINVALEGKAPLDHSHDEASHNHDGYQPSSAILEAIAALQLQPGQFLKVDASGTGFELGAAAAGGSTFPGTISELSYTVSQSGANPAGTYASLTDGSFTTGAGTTDQGSGTAFIQASFADDQYLEYVAIGGGNIGSGWSSTSLYWNAVTVQTSLDGSTWMTIFPQGQLTTIDNALTRYYLGRVRCRHIRFRRQGYLALAELRLFGFAAV